MSEAPHPLFQLAKDARALFDGGDADAALAACDAALAQYDHVRLWRLKAALLVFFGREQEATDILKVRLLEGALPGFWEIAQAGLPYSYSLVNEENKLAYFPVRKCSSTTMHNAMSLIAGGQEKGEDIHAGIGIYTLIERARLKTDYTDYFKFLVVRDPIERLRSFYWGNIIKRDHLVKDTKGFTSFHGLPTKPSYDEFLDRFDAYRGAFTTVRNHTDTLVSFAGDDPDLYDWVGGVKDTHELLTILSEKTGVELPVIDEMRSGLKGGALTQKEEALKSFYAADYAIYGKWFR